MPLDFSIDPYFDDFDSTKGHHRILFKPGVAVQSRELTQIQTLLQNQVKNFGDHVFKNGSVVIPGTSSIDLSVPFIKVATTITSVAGLVGSKITNVSGVRAIIKAVEPSGTDPLTFYLAYISGDAGGNVTFLDDEPLTIVETGVAIQTVETNATGVGSIASINPGVYYINGYFVYVEQQTAVISKYTNTPSCHILLKITESIVSSDDDTTLLDPSNGTFNFAAPGADRYTISLDLTKIDLDTPITDDYIELARVKGGVIQEHFKNPRYSELEKSLARRTFDESGNYVSSGFDIKLREHKLEENNGGLITSGDKGNFVAQITPGKAYVSGFEVVNSYLYDIIIEKARSAEHIKEKDLFLKPEYGQYIIISDIMGGFNTLTRESFTLYNDNDPTNASATVVGTGRVLAVDYLAGDVGAGTDIYKMWFDNLELSPGATIDRAGGIRFSNSATRTAFVISLLNTPITSGSFINGEIVNHTSGRTGTVKLWNPLTSSLYVFRHSHTAESPSLGDRIVGATSTVASNILSRSMLVSVGQTGMVFSLPERVPASLKNSTLNYSDLSYTVQKYLVITTDATGAGSATISSGSFDPIEVGTFAAFGTTGTIPNSRFSVTGGNTLSISAGSPVNATISIYANVTKNGVQPKSKNRTVLVENLPFANSIQLKKCDVVRIVSVVQISPAIDFTPSFDLRTNQTDYSYGRSSIELIPGMAAPSGNVRITYEYMEHSLSGDFFCVDSYDNISNPDFMDGDFKFLSPTTGNEFDLLTCIDFRPTEGEDGTMTGVNARTNDTLVSSSNFNSKIKFFVPRRDLIAVSPIGNIVLIGGRPSEGAGLPTAPSDYMPLAHLFVPPYTKNIDSISSTRYKVDGYTMSEIAEVVSRVERLEDYVTMSEEETALINYEVIDSRTGLSRFKTGIYAENFTRPLGVADTLNADYSATFFRDGLSPAIEQKSSEMQFLPNSSGFINKNGWLMINYTEETFINQPISSKVTNLNPFLVIKWSGSLTSIPSRDTWVEVRDLPTIFNSSTEVNTVTRFVTSPAPAPAPARVVTPTALALTSAAAPPRSPAFWMALIFNR